MATRYVLVSDESGKYKSDSVIHPSMQEEHGIFAGVHQAKQEAEELLGVDSESWKEMERKGDFAAFTPNGTRVELQKQLGTVDRISINTSAGS